MSDEEINPLSGLIGPVGGLVNKNKNWTKPVPWVSESWNQAAYSFFFQKILSIAIARFRWEGLPEMCDARFLELTLLTNGCATFTWPMGFPPANAFVMQAVLGTPDGNLEQTEWRAIGANGKGWKVVGGINGVMVYNSLTRLPLLPSIQFAASECANIMRTKQTVRQHMRQPVLITAPREMSQQLKQTVASIANGEPYIVAYDRFAADVQAQCMPVTSGREDMELSALQQDLKDTWNLCLSMLGIGAADEKKERMNVLESKQVENPTEPIALDALQARRTACDALNKLTGGHAAVYWNQDVESASFNFINDLSVRLTEGGEDATQ